MKKRTLIVLIVFLIIVGIVIMSVLNDDYLVKESDIVIADNVTMEIVSGTLTKTSATIIITDLSGSDYTYSKQYTIEKYEDEKWWVIKPLIGNEITTLEGYSVDENNTLTMDLNWERKYGELKEGRYRIVVKVSDNWPNGKYTTAEFTID
ncbi:MAG TPA: hypothetical protein IAB65_03125 [Candidatus Onthocola stercorigallinarum]|nr:hypothetical protein [Candidatus Onthocola stercorigallinarum]